MEKEPTPYSVGPAALDDKKPPQSKRRKTIITVVAVIGGLLFVFVCLIALVGYLAVDAFFLVPQRIAEHHCPEPEGRLAFDELLTLGEEPGLFSLTLTRTGTGARKVRSLSLRGGHMAGDPKWVLGKDPLEYDQSMPFQAGKRPKRFLDRIGDPAKWASGEAHFLVFGALFWRCGCDLKFDNRQGDWVVTDSEIRCYD